MGIKRARSKEHDGEDKEIAQQGKAVRQGEEDVHRMKKRRKLKKKQGEEGLKSTDERKAGNQGEEDERRMTKKRKAKEGTVKDPHSTKSPAGIGAACVLQVAVRTQSVHVIFRG